MPRALLSVFDKTGLISLANLLHQEGWELMASGSTAKYLREQSLPVLEVTDYTGIPEILQGRVKTLHPAIYAGILARDNNEDQETLRMYGWENIDLVVANLYPFWLTLAKPDATHAELIEHIDIGGVSLLRAAAKNYERLTVVCDSQDYRMIQNIIEKKETIDLPTRKKLAYKAFAFTSQYDAKISSYIGGESETPIHLTLYPQQSLRYGENPHQTGMLYGFAPRIDGPFGGHLHQGKALSYNNLLDVDVAWRAVNRFSTASACIVKHASPCGIASGSSLVEAMTAALACDPVSAFGGIIAVNRPVDVDTVKALGELFIEAIAAPVFLEGALDLLKSRKNCRILMLPSDMSEHAFEWRSVMHGVLRQSVDKGDPSEASWKTVTQRQPSAEELQSLRFAWAACGLVRSNAIVIAQKQAGVGIGGGLPNRLDATRLAIQQAGEKTHGAVMASDGFFPFADCVQFAATHGITAIIQPGGALRDEEVIAAADAANIAMIMTGIRHFCH